MLKKWIFGKYIKEIEEHKFLIDCQKAEIQSLACKNVEWSKMVFDLENVIKKIEDSYRPESMGNYEEVKYRIHKAKNNVSAFEYVTAIGPILMTEGPESPNLGLNRKTIMLDIHLGCHQVLDPCIDVEQATHELAVRLADGCGEAVKKAILKQGGWRA